MAADAASNDTRVLPTAKTTETHVRKRNGHWDVFIFWSGSDVARTMAKRFHIIRHSMTVIFTGACLSQCVVLSVNEESCKEPGMTRCSVLLPDEKKRELDLFFISVESFPDPIVRLCVMRVRVSVATFAHQTGRTT